MKLKKYSKYINSKIEWIWDIPEWWRIDRVKNTVDYTKYYPVWDWDHWSIKPDMYQDNWIPYVRVQNLSWDWKMKLNDIVYISDKVNLANKKSILRKWDLLIAKTWATVWKLWLLNDDIKIANTTSSVWKITFNKKDHNPNFWKHSFQSKIIQDQIYITAYQKSAQPWFNIDDLVEFYVVSPPLKIQNKISSFLDSKTLQIENLIEKDKKLIELLKERRISLVNKAVTKGLDDSVKMKDSWVEWIWEIPESWNFIKFSRVSDIRDWTHDSPSYVDEITWVPFVTSKDIKNWKIDFSWVKYVSKEDHIKIKQRSFVEKWDILMPMIWTVWNPCIVDTDISFSIKNVALFKKRKINLNFLFYYFLSPTCKSFIDLKLSWWIQSFIWLEDIRALPVIFPEINEQQKIVEFLDKETVKIDNHIKKVEKRIELYEEYKKSLIYNVVTGKVEI